MSVTARQLIPFLRSTVPSEAALAVRDVLASEYVGCGPRVAEFERAIAEHLGVAHVVLTASCTAALTLAYDEAGVVRGAPVLSTAMTCAATNIPLLHLGAQIVWMDIDAVTGNVTAATLDAAAKAHPEARVAVIMDWSGRPCIYDEIRDVATRRGLTLILDAAQSFGATFRGSRAASDADFVCYSFGPTKMFSTVEGGCVVVRDAETAHRLRRLRWYGIDRETRDPMKFWQYDIERPGFRFVPNDVFAAIGLATLPMFDKRLARHHAIAAEYGRRLADMSGLTLPPRDERIVSNEWMFTSITQRRDDFLRALHARNIHAAVPHNRNDRLRCFAPMCPSGELPGLDSFCDSYACIPIGTWLTDDDVDVICNAVRAGW